MDALRQYILSITVAAILCGLVLSIAPKGQFQGILKLVCGVFLALLVMEPITRLDPQQIVSRFTGNWDTEGEAAAAFGEEAARDSVASYIKREAEAYILDKASIYGAELVVDIEMGAGEMPVPESIRIQGSISPYGRMQLQQLLTEEFGIPKEQQIWIG